MMRDYYCCDISFPNIDFDSYMVSAEIVKPIHHAHLYLNENTIELKVLFDPKTHFGHKFNRWAAEINWNAFGSQIQASGEDQNDGLDKIDFENSELTGISNGSNQFEGGFQYIIININTIKIYGNSSTENVNRAEFYLNDSGFEVVKNYYTPLLGDDGSFNFSRMNGMDVFYPLENSEFRPEFNFRSTDNKNHNQAKIIKFPKIEFRFNNQVTELEVIKYADVIRTIASFYFHKPIDYITSIVYLEKHTITIKKIQKNIRSESSGNLWGFKNYWNFHELLNSDWQKSSLANYDRLKIVISRFLHAVDVYDSSKFLIYYSIIEYLKATHKEIKSEFSFIGSKRDKSKVCDEALELMLAIVQQNEQEEFKRKWTSLKSDLKYRPMKEPLEEFLTKSKIEIKNCTITLNRLVEIRNSLIHGSSKVITTDEIDKANKLLYRISGILILQLMGINEWKMDLELK